jgi:adenylate cyclase
MTPTRPETRDDEFWRDYLTRGDSVERRARRLLRLLPHGPRCKLCAAPFSGPAAPLMRALGKAAASKNPAVCEGCFSFIEKHHGGAEIDGSYLFADIRGSTTLAEGMAPAEYRRLLDRFYTVAAEVVFKHDGGVDKFVGDEVVAFFFPLMSGPRHAASAVETALALLRAMGHADPSGPWVPVGVGVASGVAWVGAIGDEHHTDLTAVGDVVNVAARLGGEARAGEVLLTVPTATAAGLPGDLERRSLDLKGKSTPTDVVRLVVAPPVGTPAAD